MIVLAAHFSALPSTHHANHAAPEFLATPTDATGSQLLNHAAKVVFASGNKLNCCLFITTILPKYIISVHLPGFSG